VRTIFNFLGPLTNPAGATRQLIGVSDPAYLETVAGALLRLGVARALVVSSEDGLDEMSTAGRTQVVEVAAAADGGAPLFERYTVDASELGLAPGRAGDLGGGAPAQNAETTRRVLGREAGGGGCGGGAAREERRDPPSDPGRGAGAPTGPGGAERRGRHLRQRPRRDAGGRTARRRGGAGRRRPRTGPGLYPG